jgi:hypothetical protein
MGRTRWQPCKYPERTPDDQISYHQECRACLIALHAHAVTVWGPAAQMLNTNTRQWRTVEDILEEAGIVVPVGASR